MSLEVAKMEAVRRIRCPAAPCTRACPAANDISGALWKLGQGDAFGAAETFYETNDLPQMFGRIARVRFARMELGEPDESGRSPPCPPAKSSPPPPIPSSSPSGIMSVKSRPTQPAWRVNTARW